MLNNPNTYAEAGRKAAQARNQRDEARATHWKEYHRKNRAIENEADRAEAERLYQAAYTETRNA
jgi:hypothetical protein